MKLFVERLQGWANVADVYASLYANDPFSFWLDREHNQSEPFSVIGSGALEKFDNFADLKAALDAFAAQHEVPENFSSSVPFRFRPGLVGAIDYEAKNLRFIRCTRAVVFDHSKRAMYFLGFFVNETDFKHFLHSAYLRLALVGGQLITYRDEVRKRTPVFADSMPHLNLSSNEYVDQIAEARRLIQIGDVYQICLTNQITFECNRDPLLVFTELRRANPAPFANFMKLGNQTLVGSSPESFIEIDDAGVMSTKPIKGTRPRSTDPVVDAEIATELANNLKERAENLMIVDLMRNDLAQVCDPATVTVDRLFEVQSFATVHQLVSTISGKLTEPKNPVAAVDAVFPAGSMTGAPKLRAIEHLKTLEGVERGLYSGASGYFGADYSCELAMTIRTIVFETSRDGLSDSGSRAGTSPVSIDAIATSKVSIGIGGGITIDSEPADELEETKLKAKALLALFDVGDPWAV